ncbi:hypothetical protein FGO68_gene15767 [Halteria grandinella]|uniref:Uncharacterized protein n=1 Tax=Halteria grandinella TaxID=5974 RepID=A0A8J8T639_HALGN|nr:hypothetical protein FGO68_gene15767 [Halteria grandinella]
MLFILLLVPALVTCQELIPARQFAFVNTNSTIEKCQLAETSSELEFRCDIKSNYTHYLASATDNASIRDNALSEDIEDQILLPFNQRQWSLKSNEQSTKNYPFIERYSYTRNGTVLVDFSVTWNSEYSVQSPNLAYKGQTVSNIQSLRFYALNEITKNDIVTVQFLFTEGGNYDLQFTVITLAIKNETVNFSRSNIGPSGYLSVRAYEFVENQYIFISVFYRSGFTNNIYFDRFTMAPMITTETKLSPQQFRIKFGQDQFYIISQNATTDSYYHTSIYVAEIFRTSNSTTTTIFNFTYYGTSLSLIGSFLQLQNSSSTTMSLSKLCSYREYLDINSLQCVLCPNKYEISITPFANRCYSYEALPSEQARSDNLHKFIALNESLSKEPFQSQGCVHLARLVGFAIIALAFIL